MRREVVVSAAMVLILAGVMSGCSGSESDGSSTDLPPADLSLLVASAHRTMTIETRAENILIRDCMQEAGFEFYVESSASTDVPIDEGFALFAGEMTAESAPVTGYGPFLDSPFFQVASSAADDVVAPESSATSEARNADYYFGLSEGDQVAYEQAFDGGPDAQRITFDDGTQTSAEGCLSDARREVLGDQWLDVVVTFNALQLALAQIDISADPEFSAAATDWSACMADAGYAFDSLGDAIVAGIALRGDAVQPTAEEIDQAVADVSCQESVDLANASQRAFDRLERQAIEDNLDVLLAWETLEPMILEHASAILGVTYEPAT